MDDSIELRKDGRTYELRRSNLTAHNIGLVFGVSALIFQVQLHYVTLCIIIIATE